MRVVVVWFFGAGRGIVGPGLVTGREGIGICGGAGVPVTERTGGEGTTIVTTGICPAGATAGVALVGVVWVCMDEEAGPCPIVVYPPGV